MHQPKISTISPETMDLARRAVESLEREKQRLAALTPGQRKREIRIWAQRLAEQVCQLTDAPASPP